MIHRIYEKLYRLFGSVPYTHGTLHFLRTSFTMNVGIGLAIYL